MAKLDDAQRAERFEKIKTDLLSKHQDEEISYSTCVVNGCLDMCVLKTHINKDGKVTAVETDDSIHPCMGREDAYCDPDDFRKGIYQRRACVRGRGMRADAYSPTRLLYPMRRVGPKPSWNFERISWDEALDEIARMYMETREKYGPLSIWADGMTGGTWDAFGPHLPGGALGMWGEDSYEANNAADVLQYGYCVTDDTMASGAADGGSENQTFLDTNMIILWGFDAAVCYPETVYYLLMAKDRGVPIITIDPRYTWTAEAIGTQHIFIRPGTDLAMMMAMCQVIFEEEIWDKEFCDKWVEPTGLNKWWAYVMGYEPGEVAKTPEWAEGICGVPAETIRELARLYAKSSPVYIRMVWSMARALYGKDIARGFNYLQAICGNIGKRGCAGTSTGHGVGSLTQPYSGSFLGNQWGEYGATPCMWAEMWHEAINLRPELDAGNITEEYYKAQIGCPRTTEAPNIRMIMSFPSTRNHAVGWYDTNERVEALKKLDYFVYAHYNLKNPTIPYADIVLPLAQGFLEGVYTMPGPNYGNPGFVQGINAGVKNAFMFARGGGKPEGEARYTQWIVRKLAERMGIGDKVLTRLAGVEHDDYPGVIEEACHEAWDAWRADESPAGGAKYDPPTWEEFRKTNRFMIEHEDYQVFMRKYVETDTPLPTDSGKIEFYSQWAADVDLATAVHPNSPKCFGKGTLPPMARFRHSPEGMFSPKTNEYPLYMVTPHSFFRHHSAYDHSLWVRDEARSSVWMSPSDAKARGVKDGDMVMVHNATGETMMPAYVTARMTPGVCCVIFGRWTEQSGVKTEVMPEGIDTRGNCNWLIPSDFHDDVLGPIFCNALVEVSKADADDAKIEMLMEVNK